jgi:hypothetical protein
MEVNVEPWRREAATWAMRSTKAKNKKLGVFMATVKKDTNGWTCDKSSRSNACVWVGVRKAGNPFMA